MNRAMNGTIVNLNKDDNVPSYYSFYPISFHFEFWLLTIFIIYIKCTLLPLLIGCDNLMTVRILHNQITDGVQSN